MSSLNPPPGRQRRSSLFEVSKRCMATGSSVLSQVCGPLTEETVLHQPKVQYENTYQMEPDNKFVPSKVQAIMKDILADHLSDKTYDPTGCSILAKVMAQEIRSKVHELDFKRYKFVCIVNIGEKNEQGAKIGSRCLWDTARDNFAAADFESPHLFATAVTYGFYFE